MSTKRLTTRLRDPKEWDVVLPDVPIFVEHEMYELPGGESVAILPGKAPPTGATLKYKIDESRLTAIAKQINEDLDQRDCPIQLRDGHTKHGAAQTEQPPVVGYGSHAKVTTWNGVKAITTPLHYEKGYGKLAQDRPQRSPEFRFRKNSIPDVALLATEPRLKMGMTHRYEAVDDVVRYAMDMTSDPTAQDASADPTDPTTMVPGDTGSWTPEEKAVMDRMFDYFCSTKPQMEYLCGQFKDAQAPPNQEALPAAPGSVPPLVPAPEATQAGGFSDQSQPYSAEDVMDQKEADALRARVAELEAKEKAIAKERDDATAKYAESEAERYLAGLDAEHYEYDKPSTKGLLIKATSTAERDGIAKNIRSYHKQKQAKGDGTGAPTGGLMPVDSSDSVNYAEVEVPLGMVMEIAKEMKLSPADQMRQIEQIGRERMKAARK